MCISGPIRRRKKVMIVGHHFAGALQDDAPNKGMKKSTSASTLATSASTKSLKSVQHPNTNTPAALNESDNDSSSDDEASIYSGIVPPKSRPSHRTTPAWMCRPIHRRPSKICPPEGASHLVVNRHTLRLRFANTITPGTDAGKAGAILLGAHANAEVIVNDDELWKAFQEHIRNTGPKAIASSEHIRNALVRPKQFCGKNCTYQAKAQAHM